MGKTVNGDIGLSTDPRFPSVLAPLQSEEGVLHPRLWDNVNWRDEPGKHKKEQDDNGLTGSETFTAAPFSTSIWTISLRPNHDACCSGVRLSCKREGQIGGGETQLKRYGESTGKATNYGVNFDICALLNQHLNDGRPSSGHCPIQRSAICLLPTIQPCQLREIKTPRR